MIAADVRQRAGPARRLSRHACCFLACLVFLISLPSTAAHSGLVAADPAPGDLVEPDRRVIALRFDEILDPAGTEVTLYANGAEVASMQDHPVLRPREVRLVVPPLDEGNHTVRWYTVSRDGHALEGQWSFTVGIGTTTESAADSVTVPVGRFPLEVVARALFVFALLLMVGLPVFITEVAKDKRPPGRISVTLAVVGAIGIAAGVVWIAEIARVANTTWLGTVAGRIQALKTMLLALSTAAALAAWLLRRSTRRAMLLGMVPAIVAFVLHSSGGHGLLAGSEREPVAGHVMVTLHLVAAAIWVGGVTGLLLYARHGTPMVARLFASFTPLALLAVVLLALSGSYEAYVHLGSLAALDSRYGAWLLVKTLLFGVVLGFGAHHAFRVRRRLGLPRSDPSRSVRRSLRGEVVALVLVVLAAGALAATPVPGSAQQGALLVGHEGYARGDQLDVWMALAADPVRADEPVEVILRVVPRTNVDVTLRHIAVKADGPASFTFPLVDSGQEWHGTVRFPAAAAWRIAVHIDGDARPALVIAVPVEVPG